MNTLEMIGFFVGIAFIVACALHLTGIVKFNIKIEKK